MEIKQQLQEIGLEGKKADVYLALLRLQESTAQQIAREASVERTTVYRILDELAKEGLITKVIEGKRMAYLADPATALKSFLAKKENLLESILPSLLAIQGKKRSKPKVRFYDSLEGIRKVLMESLDAKEKVRRDLAFVENVVEFLGLRFVQNQIKERAKRGIKVRSLRAKGAGPEKDWFLRKENKDVLREVRFLDASFKIEPLVIIYDNVVSIISSKKESYALVIESTEFAEAMKAMFDIAWESASS